MQVTFKIELSLSPVQLKDEWCAISIARDITEKEAAQRALAESEEKYRNLVERANDAIMILVEGNVVYINDQIVDISGYSARNRSTWISR